MAWREEGEGEGVVVNIAKKTQHQDPAGSESRDSGDSEGRGANGHRGIGNASRKRRGDLQTVSKSPVAKVLLIQAIF